MRKSSVYPQSGARSWPPCLSSVDNAERDSVG